MPGRHLDDEAGPNQRDRPGRNRQRVGRGEIEAGGRLMHSPAGLGGRSVFGMLIATSDSPIRIPELAVTHLPGLLVARYLGDSSEAALHAFTALWKALRPSVCGRAAVEPRIWST